MTSTLGGITLGALAASYVTLSSPLEFVLGKGSKIALQADVLDVILKKHTAIEYGSALCISS